MSGEDMFNSDLGLDLLMNPKKRVSSSENMSVISSHQSDDDVVSVRSIPVQGRKLIRDDADSLVDDESISTVSSSDGKISIASKKSAGDTESIKSLGSVVNKHRDHKSSREKYTSEEDIINAKREILYQFDRLEKKGYRLPRKFTMASSLDEMKQEFERIKRDKDVDGSVSFQRKAMITVVSGIELMNNYFDPVGAKLDGWSESINESIDDYDDIFEELHDKYKGKAKMAPELRLLMMLGGSAFMFHMTNSMFKTQMPGLDQVLKQNPELAKQFAAATANTMQQNSSSPLMSGIGGMFSSMFGGGGGGQGGGGILSGLFGGNNPLSPPQPSSQQGQQTRPKMKGPSGMDDILREMENTDDRVEMMSTVTDSEMGDDSSINNLLMNKKSNSRRGRKFTLDI